MRTLKTVIILSVLIIAGALIFWFHFSKDVARAPEIEKAKISDISTMLRLCTMELYEEVPVKASIGSRHLFAREVLTGTISFDVEKLEVEECGDTLKIILPREIIEIYEATEPDSYKVIDTWNDNLFGTSNFTAAEENIIKGKVRKSYRRAVYAKGYVECARKETAQNLTSHLTALTDKTVIVTDPSPKGYPD
ncbi:MAG: hypothetical protein K2M11_06280 [Paramuribaculum sp.]|nr:hypothetical protein [Paramuribaculum sp.]